MIHENPVGLRGIAFVEFASPDPDKLERLFREFGFSLSMTHPARKVDLFVQGDIRLLLNRADQGFAGRFARLHGPSICAMGWKVADETHALETALRRGAESAVSAEYRTRSGESLPAVKGIGESLIFLVEDGASPNFFAKLGFEPVLDATPVVSKGFVAIDHLTNNVEFGQLGVWAEFYHRIFGFTEVRYFDIRGAKTGLQSFALRSPCGTFCIPINEASEARSQINEYLREYKGPGIQHLAFLTDDILSSVRSLEGTSIETLDIDADYYDTVFDRVPGVTENHTALRNHKILVDGDAEGYLLQVFTKNLIGPIFIEIIQRKNHLSFGEGNFGALFRSIERDQEKRGVFREGA
ncbi:MAG: 4-hydroxyphenylpyruvate dioxygenase [Bdellovibrionales bacterium]|nr:4-hydroxyphenylpyruvate dioxygenase [Bdellovibrionales bacterium]